MKRLLCIKSCFRHWGCIPEGKMSEVPVLTYMCVGLGRVMMESQMGHEIVSKIWGVSTMEKNKPGEKDGKSLKLCTFD